MNDVSVLAAFATSHESVTLTVSVVTGSSRIVQRSVAADVGVPVALALCVVDVAVGLPGVGLLFAARAAD